MFSSFLYQELISSAINNDVSFTVNQLPTTIICSSCASTIVGSSKIKWPLQSTFGGSFKTLFGFTGPRARYCCCCCSPLLEVSVLLDPDDTAVDISPSKLFSATTVNAKLSAFIEDVTMRLHMSFHSGKFFVSLLPLNIVFNVTICFIERNNP